MTKDAIGVVYTKEYLDSEEISENILKKKSSPIGMPDVIEPEGLSLARKQYLFDDIRPFCKKESQDLVCPNPSV